MFIKYFDYLSPRVTFYYKGYLSHSSIVSGILSIIAIIFIAIIAGYFSIEMIQRNKPNAFYFNSFVEDAGIFQLNKSSLFHFINIVKNDKGNIINEEFDFTLFNIIGAQTHISNYIRVNNIEEIDHWLYGYCDKKDNFTKDLNDLITYDFFEKSACIKKYYNHTNKQYFDIGDPEFIWPSIEHGTFNEINKIYGLYIQKCDNKIIKNILGKDFQCKNNTEIENYFDNMRASKIFHLYFINNNINILNYDNPNNKFFYRIESPFNQDHYSTNDININPALIRTHNGLILDNIKDKISYILDKNDGYTKERNGLNIFMGYCFFLKNNMYYYERTYKRIQEVISSIGGINQAISIIGIYLNYLYNNFVVLSDTVTLLHSLIHIEKRNHRKKSIEYRNFYNKIKELQKQNKKSETRKIYDKKKEDSEDKTKNKTDKIETDMSRTNDKYFFKLDEGNLNVNNKDNGEIKTDIEKSEKNKRLEVIKNFTKNNKKEKTFCNYVFYKISCEKKKTFFKFYQDFRTKLFSEEHLIRNHLNIYNLLKVTEKKRHFKKSNYHLEDLINCV